MYAYKYIIYHGFRIGRDSIVFCWSPLGLFGPSLTPIGVVWALCGAHFGCLGPLWGLLGLFGPSVCLLACLNLNWALLGFFGLSPVLRT